MLGFILKLGKYEREVLAKIKFGSSFNMNSSSGHNFFYVFQVLMTHWDDRRQILPKTLEMLSQACQIALIQTFSQLMKLLKQA